MHNMLYDVSVSNLLNVAKPELDMEGGESYSPCVLFPLEMDRNSFFVHS